MTHYKLTKARRVEWLWSAIFILPITAGLLLFVIYPLITGITYSFTDYNLFDMSFVGGANYRKVFHDVTFWKSFLNVIVFSINVPINLVLSLVISAILNAKIRGSKVYRTIFSCRLFAEQSQRRLSGNGYSYLSTDCWTIFFTAWVLKIRRSGWTRISRSILCRR